MAIVKKLYDYTESDFYKAELMKNYEISEFINNFKQFIEIKQFQDSNLLSFKRKAIPQYVGIINYKNKIIIEIPTIIPIEKIFQIWILTHNNLDFKIFDEIYSYSISKTSILYLIELYLLSLNTLIKSGLNKSYISINKDLKRIKGKINIWRTLQNNLKNCGIKINCTYKEFTEDTLLNQIIKYCLIKLSYIANLDQKSKIKKSLRYFNKVSNLKRINVKIFNRITYHRLNKKYELIHLLSKFIIENSFIDNKEGRFNFFNFLIDINSLFEKFVRKILDKFKPSDYFVQKREKIYNSENSFKLKPDIMIKKYDKNILALDCKFKSKVKRDDKFQIVTYGNFFNFDKGVLIYPENASNIDTQSVKINSIKINQQGREFRILIKLIDLEKLDRFSLKKFSEEIFKLC